MSDERFTITIVLKAIDGQPRERLQYVVDQAALSAIAHAVRQGQFIDQAVQTADGSARRLLVSGKDVFYVG